MIAFLKRSFLGLPVYRWLAVALAGLALLGLSIVIRGQLNIEWSVVSLRAFVVSLGFWGPLAYIGILTARFLFLIPTGILLIAAGIVFGPFYGSLYAGIGLFLSGMTKYLFALVIGREALIAQLPERLQRWIERVAARKMSAWGLTGVCAYPFGPKHVFQIAAILSGIPILSYSVSVLAGSFVRSSIYANLGDAIYTRSGLITASLAFALFLIIPLLVPSWRRWMMATLKPETGALPKPTMAKADRP